MSGFSQPYMVATAVLGRAVVETGCSQVRGAVSANYAPDFHDLPRKVT